MVNEEGRLIEQAQRGDEQAFTGLVELYQTPVYNLCYRMLGDGYEAEDAAQETFIRAFKAMGRYDNTRPFATWLLSIASHYCIDVIRKRRMQMVPIDDMVSETLPDTGLQPEAHVKLNEEQKQVQELLASLSPIDRSAVIMYYWYDHSYEEIAENLSLSVSAVKSRLHRARHALAETWEKKQPAPKVKVERKRYESPAF